MSAVQSYHELGMVYDAETNSLGSASEVESAKKELQHLNEDNFAIFFRTHLSDERLLRVPGVAFKSTVPVADETEEIEAAETDLEGQTPDAEVERLAKQIFAAWDVGGEGIVTMEEFVVCSGLDQQFADSLGRVLGKDSAEQTITLQSLTQCIRALKSESMEDKVRLLFTFMASDLSGTISYCDAKQYLSMVGHQHLEQLGLVDNSKGALSLTYETFTMLFQNSVTGDAAISMFCDQVLQLLTRAASRHFVAADPESPSTTSTSTWQAIEQVIGDNASKENMFIFALALLQAMFWLIHFFYYKGRGMPLSFCIAKGFGLNLRVITMALYFSMMRRTMGVLDTFSALQAFIPMGFNIQVHSFLGFSMLLHSIGHMFGHIAYHEMHAPAGFTGLFTQKSLLRHSSWADRGKGDAITGHILLAIILLMAGTALYRGKGSQHYRAFSLTHYLYSVWPVFIFLHVPDLWPYFLSITGAFMLERVYDLIFMTIFSTLSASRACSNGVTFLSVPRRRETYPGSYYRIKVPAISTTEWHPFSLASGVTSHHLTFFIASSGDWTRELYRIVSDEVLRKTTKVLVQGPFHAPAKSATKCSTKATLLVASGIGITPFFSVMATKVADELKHESDKEMYASLFQEDVVHRGGSVSTMKALKSMSINTPAVETSEVQELRVVWMIRDCRELLFYLDYVHQLVKSQSSLSRHVVYVDVYLTSLGKTSDPVYMISQTLFMLTVSNLARKYMNIHFGRPDMARIFRGVVPEQVYYCGGVLVQNILTKLCRDVGAKFYPEDFDAGTTFVRNVEHYFTARKVEAARAALKKTVQKRRFPTSDLNSAPGDAKQRSHALTYPASI